MKNKSDIFAAFKPRTILLNLVSAVFFIAANTALYAADIRLSISNGCCTARSVIVLGGMERDSLSPFKHFSFSFMPRTMKNYSGAKHSNAPVTPNGAKTVLYSKFLTEVNAKNEAYYFILSHGLYDHFKKFCENYYSDNPHRDCLDYLISKI